MEITRWEFETHKEVINLFRGGENVKFSKPIIDYCSYYSKQKNWDESIILEILIKEDNLIYDIILQKEDLEITLKSNIKVLEKFEEYEYCQKGLEALKTL